ncbi:otopetrin-1 [Labeo rohita]|uniref:Otopetrin-1 n=1 Tax=Labeo rohita TaxID=84645 RepID=A0A498NX25_LABRO|nr:otopetrin-1 [Labeo rohita]
MPTFPPAQLWILPAFGCRPQYDNDLEQETFGYSVWTTVLNVAIPMNLFYRMHSVASLFEVFRKAQSLYPSNTDVLLTRPDVHMCVSVGQFEVFSCVVRSHNPLWPDAAVSGASPLWIGVKFLRLSGV